MHLFHRRRATMPRWRGMLGGLLLLLLFTGEALAAPPVASWSVSGNSGGHNYSANASIINNNNNTWSIVLQNTGNSASKNEHVLTGFFWQDTLIAAYSPVGAAPAAGSGVFDENWVSYGGPDTVGHHWGYNGALGLGSFNHGIGAAGFNLFGPPNAIVGNSPQQGVDWGIVNGFAQGGIGGNQNPFVSNTAVFTFGGQVAANQFGSARFQYGSSLTETSFNAGPSPGGPLVPEIGGVYQMLAAGLPLIGLGIARRRRRAA